MCNEKQEQGPGPPGDTGQAEGGLMAIWVIVIACMVICVLIDHSYVKVEINKRIFENVNL